MASTTLSSWALLVWEELQQRDLNAREIFLAAGLDPARLQDPNARFPIDGMQRLWRLAEEHSGDPAFGIAAGLRWNPTTFHALGYAWLASSTLAQAFHRLVRYGRLINDGSEFTLTSIGLQYQFSGGLKNPLPNPALAVQQALVVALIKMCRMLLGESFSPAEVQFSFAPNAATLLLETTLRAPLRFGCDHFAMLIDRQDMERVLPTGNPELIRCNEQIVLKHLSQLDQQHLAIQVQQRILEGLPSGRVKEDDIANALHLSTRTLQRRLLEEGVNFGELLQSTRRELAQNYIDDSQLSVSEIAYLLGFSDQANFTRAFRRWFGVTPSGWRTRKLAATA
ncbi:MAG TPA: AraC family transcriptional regulator [Dongiaceae bacterium]|nr:AraC family transcriptional regulator [Dongiaceae bacterium]